MDTPPLLRQAATLTTAVHLWAAGAGNLHSRPDCPRLPRRAGAARPITFSTDLLDLPYCVQRRHLSRPARVQYVCPVCLVPDTLTAALTVAQTPDYARLAGHPEDWVPAGIVVGCAHERASHRACGSCRTLRETAARFALPACSDAAGYTLLAAAVPESLRQILRGGYAVWDMDDVSPSEVTAEVLATAWEARVHGGHGGPHAHTWTASLPGHLTPVHSLPVQMAALVHAPCPS